MRTNIYVTIAGVQGAGKTRILRAISEALADQGALVIAEDCHPFSAKTALASMREGPLDDIKVEVTAKNLTDESAV